MYETDYGKWNEWDGLLKEINIKHDQWSIDLWSIVNVNEMDYGRYNE